MVNTEKQSTCIKKLTPVNMVNQKRKRVSTNTACEHVITQEKIFLCAGRDWYQINM